MPKNLENNAAKMFEQFAQQGAESSAKALIEPQPIPFEKNPCILTEGKFEAMPLPHKMSTKEELNAALADLRAQYQPFLQELAPAIPVYRDTQELKSFLFNGEEQITLPHYGGPLGNAVHTYATTFTLGKFDGRAVFFRCKGADYIAIVYVNGRFVGSHEGFFGEFEFDITEFVHEGENALEIRLENDFSYRGTGIGGIADPVIIEGDKLYAYTGVGWDDPQIGWHHCPPGMGIYQGVFIEVRDTCSITDLYVQTDLENSAVTLWAEVENTTYESRELTFNLSLYGQNFNATVFENKEYVPTFETSDGTSQLLAKHGKNIYKIPLALADPVLWQLDSPYLYQMQVTLSYGGKVVDCDKVTFGMRSFKQDTQSETKGMFYLNGEKIRLRGANTMGFEQQDVMCGDFDQLIDDILISKLCNMNFWRLTQRPVQPEVYEYCDKLGLMTQTDLPLFGVMRRNKLIEGARQTEEMMRLIRSHPCNVIISYMNEPWRDAGKEPHRHMLREEMEVFFEVCDRVVHYNAPGYIIKHIDGDFDPPTRGTMPDMHCYTLWYNGSQIDFGKLYRGFAQEVAPGWYYGCGEFGTEGLDFPDLMKRRYPAEWLQEPFDPNNILCSQSKAFHGYFFETPKTLDEWVTATQAHQAFAAKVMTECFRRDPRMISIAIHLFIDAWPAGWMKTIMDCERNPKPAFFAYQQALEPILLTLRSDRFTYYVGENVSIETHICNDTNQVLKDGWSVRYELHKGDHVVMVGSTPVQAGACTAEYVASCDFVAPNVNDREKFCVKAILLDAEGQAVSHQEFPIEVFEDVEIPENDNIVLITSLEDGENQIAGETVVKSTKRAHTPLYFVSRDTGHPAVAEFEPNDFRMWYDAKLDRLAPICPSCFEANDGFRPILSSYVDNVMRTVVGEKEYEGKRYIICMADLRLENPVAKRFLRNLMLL